MKVYRISKWAFGGICLLIVLLPVSRHWRLLSTGERTTGIVSAYKYRMVHEVGGEGYPVKSSEIEFEVDGVIHKTYGPENYEYKKGRSLTIFYDQEDPGDNCVLSFTGFYLNNYAALPIVLLILWYSFYLSFNNYRKKMKMPTYNSGTEKSQATQKTIRGSRRFPFN